MGCVERVVEDLQVVVVNHVLANRVCGIGILRAPG
jgi:hypothetical protein